MYSPSLFGIPATSGQSGICDCQRDRDSLPGLTAIALTYVPTSRSTVARSRWPTTVVESTAALGASAGGGVSAAADGASAAAVFRSQNAIAIATLRRDCLSLPWF